MAPRPPVQSSTQLGVSNAQLLWRGLIVRCPACGARHPHVSYTKLQERCPNCSLRFERIEGHSLGYIGINTIVTFSTTFVVMLVGAIVTRPTIPFWPMVGVTMVPALLLPIAFLPSSHTLWTAIDLILRPLRPGEIDPRFVVVDPEAGRWRA